MLKIAVCGATGYAGIELLRILSNHPEIEISAVTSERSSGKSIAEVFPHLHKYKKLVYERLDKEKLLEKADLFFLALPHGASQEAVDFFFSKGKKVIDLSADYRLADPEVYEEWYGTPHKFISTLGKAVYGLPEIYRQKIRTARLIANPGCYPTGALLGLLPAIKNKLIDLSSIIIDSKSGTSGAGRKADVAVSYCEVNEGFRAYGIGTHRHTPEIEQEITSLFGDKTVVNFTPHLLPVNRGILTTIYAKMRQTERTGTVLDLARETYEGEPFIRLLDEGGLPDIKNVRGTNFCEIGIKANTRTDTLIIVTAIDNLVKGAAGQAVHNMNIMMGFDELTALGNTALFP